MMEKQLYNRQYFFIMKISKRTSCMIVFSTPWKGAVICVRKRKNRSLLCYLAWILFSGADGR